MVSTAEDLFSTMSEFHCKRNENCPQADVALLRKSWSWYSNIAALIGHCLGADKQQILAFVILLC